MGQIIGSKCQNCGFENDFSFGGNKQNFQNNCPVPAINSVTGEFVCMNYKDFHTNLDYIFYSDKTLKGDNNGGHTFTDFDLKLNSKNNYCPKCKNYSLNFFLKLLTD